MGIYFRHESTVFHFKLPLSLLLVPSFSGTWGTVRALYRGSSTWQQPAFSAVYH